MDPEKLKQLTDALQACETLAAELGIVYIEVGTRSYREALTEAGPETVDEEVVTDGN